MRVRTATIIVRGCLVLRYERGSIDERPVSSMRMNARSCLAERTAIVNSGMKPRREAIVLLTCTDKS
eukprot:240432-Pleurochrysis_carterae.AAC.1